MLKFSWSFFYYIKTLNLFLFCDCRKYSQKDSQCLVVSCLYSVFHLFCPASDFTTESCCHFLVHHWPGFGNCNKLLWLCCNESEVIPSLLYNTLYRYRKSQQIWELSSIAWPLQCFACKLSFSSGCCCRIPWGKLFSRIYCCGFFEYLRVNQWPVQVKIEAVNSWGITASYQE